MLKLLIKKSYFYHREVRMDTLVGMPPQKGGVRKIVVLYVDRFPAAVPIHFLFYAAAGPPYICIQCDANRWRISHVDINM